MDGQDSNCDINHCHFTPLTMLNKLPSFYLNLLRICLRHTLFINKKWKLVRLQHYSVKMLFYLLEIVCCVDHDTVLLQEVELPARANFLGFHAVTGFDVKIIPQ